VEVAMARICSKVLILLLLSLFILFSVSGCSEYSFKKVWEIKVLDSADEENVFPMKVIPDAINNRIYANYASKLLCINISNGSKIWELDVSKEKAIFDFIFSGSDLYVSLIPKKVNSEEQFISNIAKLNTQTGEILWNKEFPKSYSPIFLFYIFENELIVAREAKSYALNRLNGNIMNEYSFPYVTSHTETAESSWTIYNEMFYRYLPISKTVIRAKLPDFSSVENLRFKNIILLDDLHLTHVRDDKILLTSFNNVILGSEEGEILKNIKFDDNCTVEFNSRFVNLNNDYINPTVYKDFILGKYIMFGKEIEEGFLTVNFENGDSVKKKSEDAQLGEIAINAKNSPFIWKDTLFLIYEDKIKDSSVLLAYSFPDLNLLFTLEENTKFSNNKTINEIHISDPHYLFAPIESNQLNGLVVTYSDRIIFYTVDSIY